MIQYFILYLRNELKCCWRCSKNPNLELWQCNVNNWEHIWNQSFTSTQSKKLQTQHSEHYCCGFESGEGRRWIARIEMIVCRYIQSMWCTRPVWIIGETHLELELWILLCDIFVIKKRKILGETREKRMKNPIFPPSNFSIRALFAPTKTLSLSIWNLNHLYSCRLISFFYSSLLSLYPFVFRLVSFSWY